MWLDTDIVVRSEHPYYPTTRLSGAYRRRTAIQYGETQWNPWPSKCFCKCPHECDRWFFRDGGGCEGADDDNCLVQCLGFPFREDGICIATMWRDPYSHSAVQYRAALTDWSQQTLTTERNIVSFRRERVVEKKHHRLSFAAPSKEVGKGVETNTRRNGGFTEPSFRNKI